MASAAATNESPGPTGGHIPLSGEVRRSERVDDLVDTWPIERDLVIVGIAKVSERELVVAALVWLESDFATGSSDSLGQFARGLPILLRLIIHLEGASTAENERGRHTSVARTLEGISTIRINLQNHSPLVNLLPFDLCTGEGHLDDPTRFWAQYITIAILPLHTEDGIFARSTRA